MSLVEATITFRPSIVLSSHTPHSLGDNDYENKPLTILTVSVCPSAPAWPLNSLYVSVKVVQQSGAQWDEAQNQPTDVNE